MPWMPPHATAVWARSAAAVAWLVTLVACTVDTSSVCAIPPCGLPKVQIDYTLVGFPPERVDRSVRVGSGFRGTLRVGDSVTLYLVTTYGPGSSTDTTRTALTWALSDSVAAHVAPTAQGGGRITAVALGKVGTVLASGFPYGVFACGSPSAGCDRVNEIVVVP